VHANKLELKIIINLHGRFDRYCEIKQLASTIAYFDSEWRKHWRSWSRALLDVARFPARTNNLAEAHFKVSEIPNPILATKHSTCAYHGLVGGQISCPVGQKESPIGQPATWHENTVRNSKMFDFLRNDLTHVVAAVGSCPTLRCNSQLPSRVARRTSAITRRLLPSSTSPRGLPAMSSSTKTNMTCTRDHMRSMISI
jgi:hypothetical protein